jgi:hypothetical protein
MALREGREDFLYSSACCFGYLRKIKKQALSE